MVLTKADLVEQVALAKMYVVVVVVVLLLLLLLLRLISFIPPSRPTKRVQYYS